jgi:hypothetical protein
VDTEQTLTLWDRLFAESSLGLMSLLADAILQGERGNTTPCEERREMVRSVEGQQAHPSMVPTPQQCIFEETTSK